MCSNMTIQSVANKEQEAQDKVMILKKGLMELQTLLLDDTMESFEKLSFFC